MKTMTAIAAALLFAAPACAADLSVSDAFLRASPKVGNVGAGFVTITNTGATADRLMGASADVSKRVELHTHIKDGEIFRMRQVESIAVPAGGKTELKPGGDHIMFIDLTAPLKEGQKVPVTLSFEKAGKITVEVPVLSVSATAAPAAAMDHMGHMAK